MDEAGVTKIYSMLPSLIEFEGDSMPAATLEHSPRLLQSHRCKRNQLIASTMKRLRREQTKKLILEKNDS